MSYLPILVVHYEELKNVVENFWHEDLDLSRDQEKVYNEHIKGAIESSCTIDGVEVCLISSTETSYQNKLAREFLDRYGIEYGEIN